MSQDHGVHSFDQPPPSKDLQRRAIVATSVHPLYQEAAVHAYCQPESRRGSSLTLALIAHLMKTLSLLLTLSIALFASGCDGMFKGKKAAEQSIGDFHKLYNDGKLADIYSAGHSKFKGATTEKQFLEFGGAVQRKLGKVTQTANAGFNVRTFNLTTTVVLTQTTTFEQGTGMETFTFEMDENKAVLVGWNINSKDLILP